MVLKGAILFAFMLAVGSCCDVVKTVSSKDRSIFTLNCDVDVESIIVSAVPKNGRIIEEENLLVMRPGMNMYPGKTYYYVSETAEEAASLERNLSSDSVQITLKKNGKTEKKILTVFSEIANDS